MENSVDQKELDAQLKKFLIPVLRKASYRWPARSEAIKKARKSRGLYECSMCKAELKNGEYKLDHIDPIVPVEGWDGNWDIYVRRMFCETEKFQLICEICHTVKTQGEVALRKFHRDKKKKDCK